MTKKYSALDKTHARRVIFYELASGLFELPLNIFRDQKYTLHRRIMIKAE